MAKRNNWFYFSKKKLDLLKLEKKALTLHLRSHKYPQHEILHMCTDNVSQLVEESIKTWWITLTNRIQKIKESGLTPVLIALSRKMPRLIEWLTDTYLNSHPDLPQRESLDGCELTTELSIPFRVSLNYEMEKECYVLMDDIIIHGTTLRNVASDLECLSRKNPGTEIQCYLSSIFIYQAPISFPSCVSLEDISSIQPVSLDTAKGVIGKLASLIRESNLPLDLEYPIFRIDETIDIGSSTIDFSGFSNVVHSYEGFWKNTRTFLLDRKDSQFAFDFAKVRIYNSDNGMSLEVFAPYTLPDLLVNHNISLFSSPLYVSLWEKLARPVQEFSKKNSYLYNEVNGEALRKNMSRSLTILANYLQSLSYYNSECSNSLNDGIKDKLRLREYDLKLLVGSYSSGTMLKILNQIIASCAIDNTYITNICEDIDWFAPHQFIKEYEQLKALLASHSENVESVMVGIFMFQNFANPIYEKPQYKYERLFYGETYPSLIKACQPYFKGKEAEFRIHQWIDDQIDNGAVVPKYELHRTEDGKYRWRRFFHAGLNEATLCA